MFLFAEGALHDPAGVVDDGAPAFFEFGWLGDGAVLEVVFDVAEDPWVAECGATDHNAEQGVFSRMRATSCASRMLPLPMTGMSRAAAVWAMTSQLASPR